ncbi:NAD-dependent epimerase/dehydratase family protein [Streptococcus sp. S784/96/1]|uniref:NAD-dependent epimerase/dehydratase family protein n=1 Tax=Streptococcus sp. S784/96/1 TaxID=2653499 RepID=UPI001389BAB3|nr:NAD-dependent epimerase/dehydratase family protein [Streptococcus sp. S784/96/1]
MNYLVLGASGFIGKHLTRTLLESGQRVTAFDIKHADEFESGRIKFVEGKFSPDYPFDNLVRGHDVIFHLISTTLPSTNQSLTQEITDNVFSTLSLLEACVKENVKRIVFISSGGTVYGKSNRRPFKESAVTNPIASYGIQKLMIEKYLNLYKHKFNLDFRVVRLANPYGPGQNPNGAVGAVTVFMDRALSGKEISIFGDGSSVRDYIYISDAIQGIINIAHSENNEEVYNLGSGIGTSLNDILEQIYLLNGKKVDVNYFPQRDSDLDYSVLDIKRYQNEFPSHQMLSLSEGMKKLYTVMKEENK